ncbi:hypothetical protein BHE74_00024902 [Ensete ventricosum]|nr:hypothetical protein BHE74_00024902 [Ensete ventricosum]
MSSSEEHSYTCFAKVGCRAPYKYSSDNDPSVQNGLDPEMVDHLGTKGSSPSTHFSRIMVEAKYLSAPTRSSTSHSSLMVYPRSGTSLTVAFQRRFLKPASTLELGHFSTMDTPASPATGTLAAYGATKLLPATPSDFILPRLNISTQQKRDMEFVLQRNEIVLPHLDQLTSCHTLNVVSLPPHPVDPHNGVRATSTRSALHWQSEVGVCQCSNYDFDADLPNLVGLFLQDKTSRVVGSRGGPSDDQVKVDRKGEVWRPA